MEAIAKGEEVCGHLCMCFHVCCLFVKGAVKKKLHQQPQWLLVQFFFTAPFSCQWLTVESGKNVTFFEQLFCFYQLVLVV